MPVLTTKGKEAADTITKAHNLLDSKGWVQKKEVDNQGRMCLIGALRVANGPGEEEAKRIVRALLGVDITLWNDKEGRTYAEVKTVLQAAAHIAWELAEE
jgi:hypothetical protein